MDLLSWILEPLRIWLEGGSWAEISRSGGFTMLVVVICFVVPASLFALAYGVESWRKTPIGWLLGVRPEDPADDRDWLYKARDIDKDGIPDI